MSRKSNDDIAAGIAAKVQQMIRNELPTPSCALERQKHQWRVDQVKKKIATLISPGGNGVSMQVS